MRPASSWSKSGPRRPARRSPSRTRRGGRCAPLGERAGAAGGKAPRREAREEAAHRDRRELTAAEERLARTASHDQAALAAELQDETAARLGAAQSEIAEGSAQLRPRSRRRSTPQPRPSTSASSRALRPSSGGGPTRPSRPCARRARRKAGGARGARAGPCDPGRPVARGSRRASRGHRSRGGRCAGGGRGPPWGRGGRRPRGGAWRTGASGVRAPHRGGGTLEAQVAQGLREAAERISGEVRTELAIGLADAERTLDERAASPDGGPHVQADRAGRQAVGFAGRAGSRAGGREPRRPPRRSQGRWPRASRSACTGSSGTRLGGADRGGREGVGR